MYMLNLKFHFLFTASCQFVNWVLRASDKANNELESSVRHWSSRKDRKFWLSWTESRTSVDDLHRITCPLHTIAITCLFYFNFFFFFFIFSLQLFYLFFNLYFFVHRARLHPPPPSLLIFLYNYYYYYNYKIFFFPSEVFFQFNCI